MEVLSSSVFTLENEVESYLAVVASQFAVETATQLLALPGVDRDGLGDEIFELVTSREFCYLSRTRTAPYREETVGLLQRRLETGEPFRFFYDIGPGYHASTRPGELDLRFDVGLSELLVLFQVSSLCRRIAELYPPGARFWLVVDNLCGLRTNDIPVERTAGYCARLRQLIAQTEMADRVDLIVESEEFELEEYARESLPSADAVENVERFLGRRCSLAEAADRIERYQRTGAVTEHLLTRLVRGVHMTQRATGATLGFRPFPGGDSRTQCGEVAVSRNAKGRLRPILLTSRNIDAYDCTRLRYPDLLPSTIPYVTYAEQLDG